MTTAKQVRYAVMGAGWIAQEAFYARANLTGNSKITALISGDSQKAKALGEHYGISQIYNYNNYQTLLTSGEIDAVYLALPNSMHLEFAVPILEAGIHLLLEKPMATSEEECRAIIAAAEKGNAKLMIAYRLHFEPATLETIELVRAGKIGEPKIFSSVFTQIVSETNHRSKGEYWAGPIPDMGPYPINAVRNLFGAEPTGVFATSIRSQKPGFENVDESVSVIMHFPENRLAQFTVSYGANPVDEYRVVGTQGDLQVKPGYMFGKPLVHHLTLGENKTEEKLYPNTDQFGGELKYFSDCILNDIQPEPSGYEGLADVLVIEAIHESIKTSHPQPVKSIQQQKSQPQKDQAVILKPVESPPLIHAAKPSEK